MFPIPPNLLLVALGLIAGSIFFKKEKTDERSNEKNSGKRNRNAGDNQSRTSDLKRKRKSVKKPPTIKEDENASNTESVSKDEPSSAVDGSSGEQNSTTNKSSESEGLNNA